MILTCPSCSRRFLLDPAQLGLGRRVKCGNCGHVWHQDPPLPPPTLPPAPEPVTAGEGDGFLAADLPPPAEANPPGGDPPRMERVLPIEPSWVAPESATPLPPGSNLPAISEAPPRRRGALLRWGTLAVVVTAVLGTVAFAREALENTWPPAAKAYHRLDGLFGRGGGPGGILVLEHTKDAEARDVLGQAVLVVEGVVANRGTAPAILPPLRAEALDAGGAVLFAWRVPPPVPTLDPGASATFSSRVPEASPVPAMTVRVSLEKSR